MKSRIKPRMASKFDFYTNHLIAVVPSNGGDPRVHNG